MALSARRLTSVLLISVLATGLGGAYEIYRIRQIDAFNHAIRSGRTPDTDTQSFQAKFSAAYWLANSRHYKESTLLFMQLAESGDADQRSAVQHNLGNIFFLRGLEINGTNITVRDETEYLLRQAKSAYVQSLKLDNRHWDARHNLDRVLTMLPATPAPGVGESDKPGLIMGSIPVGLP
jgi:mxaK protein